jgi:hypothetical protein
VEQPSWNLNGGLCFDSAVRSCSSLLCLEADLSARTFCRSSSSSTLSHHISLSQFITHTSNLTLSDETPRFLLVPFACLEYNPYCSSVSATLQSIPKINAGGRRFKTPALHPAFNYLQLCYFFIFVCAPPQVRVPRWPEPQIPETAKFSKAAVSDLATLNTWPPNIWS